MSTPTTPTTQSAPDRVVETNDPLYTKDLYHDEYYKELVANEKYRSHALRLAWAKQMLDPQASDRIIDLGCGGGMVAKYMASHGATLHGVDLSPLAVASARKLSENYPNATFEVADASHVPSQPDASFDKGYTVDVVEHCSQEVMTNIFREAMRLLKPGGLYYVYCPNPRHWIERAKEAGILKQNPTHTGMRPTETIADALKQVGFEIVANPKTASMIPGLNAFEWLWRHQPIAPELGVYRIVLLAKKPV